MTRPDALLNQCAFKLSHGSDYLEHEAAGWRAQIQIVVHADKCHAICLPFGQSVNQVPQAATKAI
ncbi:MAG TPA: hypothetical protein VKB77_09125 [Terriglobales bacterium]|nr:hypothetical protein [Terriglobales bacterium]